MIKIVLSVDGMKCGMCESHINDSIRKWCNVKKVSSSHKKGRTVVIAEDNLNIAGLKSAVSSLGYLVGDVQITPYNKGKGLFSFIRRNND